MRAEPRVVAAEDCVEFRMLQLACHSREMDDWFRDFLFPEHITAAAFEGRLRGAGHPWDVVLAPTREALLTEVGDAVALVVERQRVDDEVLRHAPSLRTVVVYGTDTSRVDRQACAARGIAVRAVDRRISANVADHTFMLLLALARRLLSGGLVLPGEAVGATAASTEQGGHPPTLFNWAGVSDVDALAGRRMAVLGAGEIGQRVLRRAVAFDMEVGYVARNPVPSLETGLGARRLAVDELADWADVVSLHVPYSAELHHVVDRDFLQRLGPSGLLLNVSRGMLIDTDALIAALHDGTIAGAGLDVFPQEPMPPDHPLLRAPNVVLTPHLAGASRWHLVTDVIATMDAVAAGLDAPA